MFLRSQIADMATIDSWRNSILVFDSTPLADIARTVERMYGVNVEFQSDTLRRITFTGTISNNSITNIFYIISLTYPISYTIDGSRVIIGDRAQ
jgi:ferric-dicitrate binding protein FerR (iron transport regulator)